MIDITETDASGNEVTSTTHIGYINPIRYRGYYFDAETGIETVKNLVSSVDLTCSTGISISGTPSIWKFDGQFGVSIDTEGNVALQVSGGAEFHVGGGATHTIVKFNIYDVLRQIYTKIMEW